MAKILPYKKLKLRKKITDKRTRNISFPFAACMAFALLMLWAHQVNNTSQATAIFTSHPENLVTCTNPSIVDGDTFKCGKQSIRLEGIDTAEMPGHCRPGRECAPGDPYAARDHLRSLTRGTITCTKVKTDIYGRIIARCKAGHEDLSCAMIGSGHAVRRYNNISC